MELESYFDFLSPEGIRIKGTRIGIETVLEDYLEGASPEEIVARYRTLTLAQVYATLPSRAESPSVQAGDGQHGCLSGSHAAKTVCRYPQDSSILLT